MGGAAAQTIFTGEGYSSSQLSFFNGPNSATFQPLVENYWNSYVQSEGGINPAIRNQSTTMSIWFNSFPLSFDKQIQLQSSSFTTNVPVNSNISSTEMQSAYLKRDISFKFNPDLSWKYTPADTSFTLSKGNGVPPKDSQGQIISQGIVSLFG